MSFIGIAGEDIEIGDLVYITNTDIIKKCHKDKDAELIDEILYEMYDVLVELG